MPSIERIDSKIKCSNFQLETNEFYTLTKKMRKNIKFNVPNVHTNKELRKEITMITFKTVGDFLSKIISFL